MRTTGQTAIRAGLAAVLAIGITLTGCTAKQPNRGAGRTGTPTVVASTDVWGSVAESVAGDDARVSSIIKSGSADPHSYEASPSDAAAITDATVVVYNGGGYDAWVDAVLENRPEVPAVNAYALLDAAAVGEPQPANEHVFYDMGTAKAVAAALAEQLAQADPAKAAGYRARATEFGQQADAILEKERALRAAHPGTAVVATEPVAHYLLLAGGLADKTPPGFTAAVEQDTDPAPIDVAAVLDLISGRQVAAVMFNDQTITAGTRRVRSAAQDAGVPVVAVTETLPVGGDYLSWQRDTADRLANALAR